MKALYDLDAEKARRLMIAKRWCMSDLARQSKVSYTTVRGLLTTTKSRLQARTMYRLADAFGVDINELEK